MDRLRTLGVAMSLFCGVQASAHADGEHARTRGELLYSTHCGACHTEQIHWREKRLVKDWSSLIAEVRRWQANIGLIWSEEEMADTARYLNSVYYHFPGDIKGKGSVEGGASSGGYD